MAEIKWYSTRHNRAKYAESNSLLYIPAEYVDPEKSKSNIVKVKIGIDSQNKRLILHYSDSPFKGIDLRKPKNAHDGKAYKISLGFIPQSELPLTNGYYDIKTKVDEIEIDFSKTYKTRN